MQRLLIVFFVAWFFFLIRTVFIVRRRGPDGGARASARGGGRRAWLEDYRVPWSPWRRPGGARPNCAPISILGWPPAAIWQIAAA